MKVNSPEIPPKFDTEKSLLFVDEEAELDDRKKEAQMFLLASRQVSIFMILFAVILFIPMLFIGSDIWRPSGEIDVICFWILCLITLSAGLFCFADNISKGIRKIYCKKVFSFKQYKLVPVLKETSHLKFSVHNGYGAIGSKTIVHS